MKTKFMSVAAALTAALALVFGVAAPGVLPSLPVATAQAQETTIPVTPLKHGFSNLKANPDPTFEFTVGADATVTSLEFSVSGKSWVQGYKLEINGMEIAPKFTRSDDPRQNFTITHDGLNISVRKEDVVRLTPDFTAPKVTGSVSVALKGTTSTTTGPDPTEPQPSPEPEPGTSVTPAAPTAVDPATADSCVEKGYINIPETEGVDYFIDGERKQTGQHSYEGQKVTVKVTAKPQNGYQFAADAKTEWSFDFSGVVKDCSDSSEDPKPPAVEGRHFDAIGHEFAVKADPVDPTNPNAFTAKVTAESHMKYATVRIETDATILDPQKYNLTLGQIELGVTLQKSNVNIGSGFITMDVVPVKDGKLVDSAVVPKDAVFTFTNNLSQNKNLKVTLDVYGEKKR